MEKLQYQTHIIYTGYSASPTDVRKRPHEPANIPTPYPFSIKSNNKYSLGSVNSKKRTGYYLSDAPGQLSIRQTPGSGNNRIIIPDHRRYATTLT